MKTLAVGNLFRILIRECDESRLNKLPSTRIFIAAENGWLEVLELVALFFLKTITFRVLTTGRRFP